MGNKVFTRKATFVETSKGVFRPVNKRAKYVAHKLGKRTKVSISELRSTKGKGTYTFYKYTDNGLKAIR